ncbi:hypothetical protein CANINC_004475 [Pichia inconspicua]|uniref:BTB domain-containing protein n=1 Tax=Pichia inconspicua TaxID=52247 RepID=A0A4T0WVM0_9ASCO|nr:hypothetical protein CANINC_004475 [[Candida] inconspicua]
MNIPNQVTVTKEDEPLIKNILPHDRIYTIQVGWKKYPISGASLSYDAPSYFTEYFLSNPLSVLHLDRSPVSFEHIYLHLQGYSIKVHDEYEFLYLLYDASYFRLERLHNRLLREPLIITIGGETFRLHKDLLSQKGNHPNYFSFIYDSIMMDPYQNFRGLIRPPPRTPCEATNSPEIFKDILNALRGLEVEIRNDEHRRNILQDCRYYQFFALEQKFIKHKISRNPFTGAEEIMLSYRDVKISGLLNDTMDKIIDSNDPYTIVKYQRPYVDESHRDLVLQLDSVEVSLMVNATLSFYNLIVTGKTAVKLKKILAKISDDYMYSEENGKPKLTILIRMTDSVGTLNNLKMEKGWLDTLISVNLNGRDDSAAVSVTESDRMSNNKIIVVKLLQSLWTINVQGRNKIWMDCLKFEGVLDVSHFNEGREFL